jgi:hypothetical protein
MIHKYIRVRAGLNQDFASFMIPSQNPPVHKYIRAFLYGISIRCLLFFPFIGKQTRKTPIFVCDFLNDNNVNRGSHFKRASLFLITRRRLFVKLYLGQYLILAV